jgi:ATP-binding cassette subfamily C (CFTR/MRP) protein 1
VVAAASLLADINMLPAGDLTEIGERGINLSGGQKARVSLARVCYAEAPLVMLDDPLAAVDAHVGRSLVQDCIMGFLRGRTRLLVTNALHVLPEADLIVVMRDGHVAEQGSFSQLREANGELAQMMHAYGQSGNDLVELAEAAERDGAGGGGGSRRRGEVAAAKRRDGETTVAANGGAAAATLVEVERRKHGSVEFSYYWKYCQVTSHPQPQPRYLEP